MVGLEEILLLWALRDLKKEKEGKKNVGAPCNV
jgi:hypothetical protein